MLTFENQWFAPYREHSLISSHPPVAKPHGLNFFYFKVAHAPGCPSPPVRGAHGGKQEVFSAAEARPVHEHSQDAGFQQWLG